MLVFNFAKKHDDETFCYANLIINNKSHPEKDVTCHGMREKSAIRS
jgi:hypothetical protein